MCLELCHRPCAAVFNRTRLLGTSTLFCYLWDSWRSHCSNNVCCCEKKKHKYQNVILFKVSCKPSSRTLMKGLRLSWNVELIRFSISVAVLLTTRSNSVPCIPVEAKFSYNFWRSIITIDNPQFIECHEDIQSQAVPCVANSAPKSVS